MLVTVNDFERRTSSTESSKELIFQNKLYRRIPYFLGLAPLLGLAPFIRLQILLSTPVRVSAPPSDKCPLQISLDFDQKDGESKLFLNQLTRKSLGLFFFIEYSVKYLYAVQKMISS